MQVLVWKIEGVEVEVMIVVNTVEALVREAFLEMNVAFVIVGEVFVKEIGR